MAIRISSPVEEDTRGEENLVAKVLDRRLKPCGYMAASKACSMVAAKKGTVWDTNPFTVMLFKVIDYTPNTGTKGGNHANQSR